MVPEPPEREYNMGYIENISIREGLNVQYVPLVKDTKSRGENKLMNIGMITVFDSDIMKSTHCSRVLELNSLSG